MTVKLSILFLNISYAILAINYPNDNTYLYVIGVLCMIMAKAALIWDGAEKLNVKSLIITIALSITGGYIGYVIGLAFFLEREMIRLVVLLAFVFLGDMILFGIKQDFPEIFKTVLKGAANLLIKKLDKNNNQDNETIE